MPDFKPSAPSNRHRNAKEMSVGRKSDQAKKERESPRSQSDTSRSQKGENGDKNQNGFKRRDQPSVTTLPNKPKLDKLITNPAREQSTNIIPGFAYSVVDLFENESFNMVYILKRTENDLKVRINTRE